MPFIRVHSPVRGLSIVSVIRGRSFSSIRETPRAAGERPARPRLRVPVGVSRLLTTSEKVAVDVRRCAPHHHHLHHLLEVLEEEGEEELVVLPE